MTDVIDGAKSLEAPAQGMVKLDDLDQQLIGQLVDRARSQARLPEFVGIFRGTAKRICWQDGIFMYERCDECGPSQLT